MFKYHKIIIAVIVGILLSTVFMGVGICAQERKGTIGILPKSIECDWFSIWAISGKWYLESQGYDVIVGNPQWEADKQITIMRTWALDPDIKGILISCSGGEAASVGIQACIDAGKVVIVTDAPNGYSEGTKLTVVYPVYESSYGAGEMVIDLLKNKYGEPKGTVVLGVGNLTDTNHVERAAGVRDALKQYPGIEINEIASGTGDILGTASTRLSSLLRSLPNIDAIFSIHMPEFQGFVSAVQSENLAYPIGDPKHIILAGIDSAPYIINPAIREKIVDFAVDQPVLGYNAIGAYYLVKILEEGDSVIPKAGDILYPGDIPETKPPYEELDFVLPGNSWAPAKVIDTMKERGHNTILTNFLIIDSTNVDDPSIWSNFYTLMSEKNLPWNF